MISTCEENEASNDKLMSKDGTRTVLQMEELTVFIPKLFIKNKNEKETFLGASFRHSQGEHNS
ncbi:CLUMA_CG001974, isoform A [Clunio marinus]|uniref:CLUMA_CG001974, isoform A n=1 Tax=Clunio marinus TaxID=568069 RepID=A0A1J1HPQ4_9DIPT|nr:CLUMA_CG001974, isoform A [Clunio marinus]